METTSGNPGTSQYAEEEDDDLIIEESPMDDSLDLKDEDTESMEECSVCRNVMVDTTSLSDCVHEFCYDCIIGWLTKGSGQFCPMCKTPVKYIQRKETGEKKTVQEIQSQKEPEATASEDLITEKRIVSRKIRSCRRIMNRIDELIGSRHRSRDEPRTSTLNAMKQLCVSQLNSLQMLRDDIDHGAAKALVVSTVAFRRLVYEKQVVSQSTNAQDSTLTRAEFLENIEHYRQVLSSFLTVELKAIPAKDQPLVDTRENGWIFYTLNDVLSGQENEIITRIVSLIADRGIKDLSSQELDAALNGQVSVRYIQIFQRELRSLLESRKTFLEWCGSVTYRNRTDREGGESAAHEVVTVDDSVEIEPPSDRRVTRAQNRCPVYVPFDHIFGQGPSSRLGVNVSSPTLYDLINAPLRLASINPCRVSTTLPHYPVTPSTGMSWAELTRPTAPTQVPSSKSVPLVNLDDDGVGNTEINSSESNSSDDDDVQVVENDDTIVLDDSRSSRPSTSAQNGCSVSRKRKFSSPLRAEYVNVCGRGDMPNGLVDDLEKLIDKYNLATKESIIQDALKVAIEKSLKTARDEESAKIANIPAPSTNSPPSKRNLCDCNGSDEIRHRRHIAFP